MAVQQVSNLTIALIGGGFTSFGVLAKIGYDSMIARRSTKREDVKWLADDRQKAYNDFLEAVKHQKDFLDKLWSACTALLSNDLELAKQREAEVPDPPRADLISAQERIGRVARHYCVITAADAIVQILNDMANAGVTAIEQSDRNVEVTWSLLKSLFDDRMTEFIYAYREDLGLGRPAGAPKRWRLAESMTGE